MASLSSPACPPPRAAPRALARGGRSRRLGSRAFASSSTPAPSPDAFRALEAEIDAAGSPSSSGASARLTLADAVWKVSRDAPMSLRDRAACAVAAEATQALCDSGLDGAGLLAVLAVREAMRRNGFDRGDGRVRPVAGFKVFAAADEDDPRESTAPAGLGSPNISRRRRAEAHCWLEIDGRVLDVAADGMALCDAARRLGVDYSDPERMAERFGTEALRAGGYAPRAARPLVVLGVPVPVGGTRTRTLAPKLTLETPPERVEGAREAAALVDAYRATLEEDDRRVAGGGSGGDPAEGMPQEAAEVYRRVAGVVIETVRDEREREAKLRGEGA